MCWSQSKLDLQVLGGPKRWVAGKLEFSNWERCQNRKLELGCSYSLWMSSTTLGNAESLFFALITHGTSSRKIHTFIWISCMQINKQNARQTLQALSPSAQTHAFSYHIELCREHSLEKTKSQFGLRFVISIAWNTFKIFYFSRFLYALWLSRKLLNLRICNFCYRINFIGCIKQLLCESFIFKDCC